MGIECEHGQLARSCNICELEALLKSSEEEMLFWRHAHRDADKRATELEAEIEKALKVNNPCGHTGFESTVCEICGYPDPRKLIAKLKEENTKLRAAVNEIAYIVNCKAYNMAHGPTISGICDKALRGGEAK